MIKKGIVLAVLGAMVLPFSVARASSADTLWENLANAQSVDVSVDLDIETKNESTAQPANAHVHVDAVTDFSEHSAFDLAAWSTDANGVYRETDGSLLVVDDAMYFRGANQGWSVITLNGAPVSNDEVSDDIAFMQDGMEELLDAGVIDYTAETLDVVNGTMAMRYAYTVNNDRLVDYLVDQGMLDDETEQMALDFLADVSMSGNVWVDVAAMLPVMITFKVQHTPSETSYTTVELSVLFKSFDEPVVVDVPENATVLGDDSMDESAAMMMTSMVGSVDVMDTDGDGLRDNKEHVVWHTNPLDADSDGDGYSDYTEVINGYDPNGTEKLDSDGDGLTDYAEMTVHWTDRYDSDSDNDSYPDGLEIANGYNPNGLGRW